MNKIALIIPYFGKFPKWMPLYLFSCSKQENIDFLYFTDCELPDKIYSNTIFFKTTFEAYCERVSKRLEIKFHPSAPYKLCDLRPFYGIIHEEELEDYEWWGFGDLDLVYEDLSKFTNEHNLRKYDLLTTHVNRVAGHFTIIKIKSRYTKIAYSLPNWKDALQAKEHRCLDEGDFSELVKPLKNHLFDRFYFHVLNKFINPYHHFFCYYLWGKITHFLDGKCYMKECFTTFHPTRQSVIAYDLSNCKFSVSNNQLDKIRWGGIYLHFLLFKKTPYYKTDLYWREGFYKIPEDYDFEKGGIIEITTEGIKLKEDNR